MQKGQNGSVNLKLVALVVAILLVFWFFVGRYMGSKGKIQKVLDTAVTAVETEDTLLLMSIFSKNYQDDSGITFQMLLKLSQMAFDQFEDLDVDISKVDIQIDGGKATVTLQVWGEGTQEATMGKGALPVRESYQEADAQIDLIRSGSDWKIQSTKNVTQVSNHLIGM